MKHSRLYLSAAVAAIAMSMASCSSTPRSPLTYFTDIDAIPQFETIGDYRVRIAPADELFITVTSVVPEATAQYNTPLVNPAASSSLVSQSQPRQQTYIVDSKGDINFPMLGRIHVAGMTLEELTTTLEKKISEDVLDPIVRAELINFKVNVAGEVKQPGAIPVTTSRFSVLDALTAAGDLTEYGERNNVLVIREENGQRTHTRLDLNSAESLSSPYFYLKQNDYVYVEPNKIRKDNSKYNQNNAFKLSVISTVVSGCSVVASLIIALTR